MPSACSRCSALAFVRFVDITIPRAYHSKALSETNAERLAPSFTRDYITYVRAAARITKLSKVTAVQVDRVALGTSAGAVVTNGAPKNSGAASQIYSYTAWRGVAPRTCTDYRVRADYSIRWTDGAISKFSVLSSLTRLCGPTNPPVYANCTTMHEVFPHGVGRAGATDHTSGTPVTTFYVSTWIYNGNTKSDADKDGIACEKA